MNVLLINHYAGSKEYGMEYRPYYLAREWVKQGHQVTIVGATFSHLRLKNPKVAEDYAFEDIEDVRYIWFKTPAYGGSIARIKNMLVFMRKLQKYSRRLAEDVKPEIVIASSTYPLDNYPAYKIARMAGAKYTYEIHDLWPLSPMLIGGYSKWHPFIMVMQHAEDFAYRHVDKVVSLLWNAEAHCRERGLGKNKFICVPNGYNPEEWTRDKFDLPIPKEHQELFDSLKGKTIVGFAGGFAAAGTLDVLINAANRIKNREDLHIVLVGKGPEKASYESLINKNKQTNISILPSVSKSLVPSVVSHFDICFFGGVHSVLHQYGMSANKLTDYMLCGKPIIQACDEPGSVIEKTGCGIRVEAENVGEVARAIETLLDMSKEERESMGQKGLIYTKENLQWSVLAEKFINSFS